jgi:putative transposase
MIFVTKYRRDVFEDVHITALKEIMNRLCDKLDITLKECDGEDDHIHLLIEYPPTTDLIRVVKTLKGVSAREMRKKYRLKTHRNHLWSRSYFAASCGGGPLEMIKEYIEDQRIAIRKPGPALGTPNPNKGMRYRKHNSSTG